MCLEVDEILAELGKSKAHGENKDAGLNNLARVLVDVGYAQREDIQKALELQGHERSKGTRRFLGQILISMKILRE